MNQAAIEFIMRPHSLKLRITARRLRESIIAGLPDEPDAEIREAIDNKTWQYVNLMTHTISVNPCVDHPDVLAFAKWFADSDDLLQHFDDFIALPDVIVSMWLLAFDDASEPLTIATKPPHLLTEDERAILNDPKAPKPKPVGESLPTG